MEQPVLPCPVCTLFLREGMSMESHLNTHPKDQVIEALVRLYSGNRVENTNQYGHQTIVNPFQLVSEEHIFLGRQQVTTNILHTPFMGIPVYPNPPIVGSTPDFNNHSGSIPFDVTSSQESPAMVTLVNYSQEDEYPGDAGEDDVNEEVEQVIILNEERTKERSPIDDDLSNPGEPHSRSDSRLTHHSEISKHSIHSAHSLELNDDACQDYASDSSLHPCQEEEVDDPGEPGMDYQDEYCSKELTRSQLMEEAHDIELSSSGLNIQANEKMPPHGELSGQGSLGNSVNSVWLLEGPMMSGPVWVNRREDEKKKYPCLYCSEEFNCPKERRVHVATLHCATEAKPAGPETKESMCLKCGLQLASAAELRVHVRSVHKNIQRKCSVCSEEFATQALFLLHLTHVHPLECRTCGKTFNNKYALYTHTKIHMTVKPYSCTLCPKTFVTNQKLKEHMNGHTGVCPYQCNMCDKKFRRYSNLKQHRDIQHLKKKKITKEFFCDCGESFPTKKKLAWHKETHDTKPKQCMYCTERYVHLSSLTRHIRKKHDSHYLPKVGKKNAVCPICNMVFMDTSLKVHLRTHGHGVHKQFGCIVCGKRFLTKWNLSVHRWTHASRMSKPYKCTMCKRAFIRHSELQVHMRSHLGSKPFVCNFCGCQFVRKHNWQRHEKEHTADKRFTCGECGKAFHRSYYLLEHSRIHTGLKPYTCHICNKTSTTKSNHNKHVRTHHAREAVNTES